MVTGLGRQVCRAGYEVCFYRVADLVTLIGMTWREGRFESFRRKFDKVDLIILDEMGFGSYKTTSSYFVSKDATNQ